DEYLWGPSFLVAPILQEDQTTRNVYLPSGVWIDFWNDAAFIGNRWITAEAPLETIPLYVKAGSFIPTRPHFETTRDYSTDTLIVHYYPDANASLSDGILYNDDGVTPDAYTLDSYETIAFQGNASEDDISIHLERDDHGYPGAPDSRKMIFRLHRIATQPETVQIAGNSVMFVSTMAEFLAADSAVFYDDAEHHLHIGFVWDGAATILSIEGEQLLHARPSRSVELPEITLYSNYPNPFNSTTQIQFGLTKAADVTLKIYDVTGREVRMLLHSEHFMPGTRVVTFNAQELPSGIYFCRLQTKDISVTKKMVLLK
ncbi:T9SS type A sorting domain-containing protein, partial [bacterium]|nr:T9SS type A sorting domain-containing protein [bacterium]